MHDPYLYPNTNVLRNKFNIKENQKELNLMEAEYTSYKMKQLIQNKIKGSYNFEHLCEIHKGIFKDIYDWAGSPRTIDMEKQEPALGGISIQYPKNEDIKAMASNTLDRMKDIDWENLTVNEKTESLSKNMAELWKIHPFREGNTRTVVTFCCDFAESRGFELDRGLFEENSLYMRNALVAASSVFSDLGDLSKPEYLINIVRDSIEKGVENREAKLQEKRKQIHKLKHNMER